MSETIEKYRFSRAQFHRFGEAGISRPGKRLELLHGQVFVTSEGSPRRLAAERNLQRHFQFRLGDRCVVPDRPSIILDDFSEPQPNVLMVRADFPPRASQAVPQDVFLAVEVAEETLDYDRSLKFEAYAAAAIPEVWVVNLSEDRIEIFRSPGPAGFAEKRQCGRGETLSVQAFPDTVFAVAELLP